MILQEARLEAVATIVVLFATKYKSLERQPQSCYCRRFLCLFLFHSLWQLDIDQTAQRYCRALFLVDGHSRCKCYALCHERNVYQRLDREAAK
jgi:hypothetical protein